MSADPLPSAADVEAAAGRLRGVAVRTPLLESERLNERVGGRVLLKAECLQRTGSFKFRGAYNTISQIDADAVVAYSSGNHAQGVAAAARLLGKAATVVMPADAPAIKIENTRAYGAEVRLYDRARESREAIGTEIAARTGAALIRPYDDPRIIAGQGTAGLELAEQARERGATPDLALAPCGGGGLIAGCALALTTAFPGIAIYAVEPDGLDDTRRSLAAGERVANAPGASSICDALLVPTPGELTFRVNRQLLAGGLAVSDDEVRGAMALAFRHLKLVLEPGGAVALAAALSGRLSLEHRTAAVVLSGGNVEPALFAAAITGCSV
ncbi:MAG TPA: threonine/serine dehydratase [Geminicoccaceae bacterium]